MVNDALMVLNNFLIKIQMLFKVHELLKLLEKSLRTYLNAPERKKKKKKLHDQYIYKTIVDMPINQVETTKLLR